MDKSVFCFSSNGLIYQILLLYHCLLNWVCKQNIPQFRWLDLLGKDGWRYIVWICIALYWVSECSNFSQFTAISIVLFVLLFVISMDDICCHIFFGTGMRFHQSPVFRVCNWNQVRKKALRTTFNGKLDHQMNRNILKYSSEAKVRGILLAMSTISTAIAPLIIFVLANLTSWRNIALCWCLIQGVAAIALFCVSEFFVQLAAFVCPIFK